MKIIPIHLPYDPEACNCILLKAPDSTVFLHVWCWQKIVENIQAQEAGFTTFNRHTLNSPYEEFKQNMFHQGQIWYERWGTSMTVEIATSLFKINHQKYFEFHGVIKKHGYTQTYFIERDEV